MLDPDSNDDLILSSKVENTPTKSSESSFYLNDKYFQKRFEANKYSKQYKSNGLTLRLSKDGKMVW